MRRTPVAVHGLARVVAELLGDLDGVLEAMDGLSEYPRLYMEPGVINGTEVAF